jgi:hypothetical protein
MADDDLYNVREAEPRLGPGDLIAPGRFGKRVLTDQPTNPHFFREHLLEAIRLAEFSGVLSRLTSAFAFEAIEAARLLADSGAVIYRIEPVDADVSSSRLDLHWLTIMRTVGYTTDEVLALCRAYWAGEPTGNPHWERLYPCALRVVEVVESVS